MATYRRERASSISSTSAVVVALCLALNHVGATSECSLVYGTAATYDLSSLTRSSSEPSFSITDGDIPCTEGIDANYTWVFNVCGDVTASSIPTSCTASAAAYQVTNPEVSGAQRVCYNTGYYDSANPYWALLDTSDPSKGVTLTYKGDACRNGVARETKLIFSCADRDTTVPTTAYEYEKCKYSIEMPSWAGCPQQCPIGGRSLCSGNGHCAYDTDAKTSRCFCDNGWSGADCSKEKKHHSSPDDSASVAITVIIVILFVLSLALGGALYFLIKQVREYKDDASHYMELQGGDERANSKL